MKTFTNYSIVIEECHSMFEKAKKEAEKLNIGIAFCVVDHSGVLKYFSRSVSIWLKSSRESTNEA